MRAFRPPTSLLLVAVLAACADETPGSDVRIGNGEAVTTETDATRAIVMLQSRSGEGYRGHCSATFLSDTTLVTAAHCLYDYETGGVFVQGRGDERIASLKAYVPTRARQILEESARIGEQTTRLMQDAFRADPSCRGASTSAEAGRLSSRQSALMSELPRYDLAILVFPAGTGDAVTGGSGYYGVVERAPRAGDRMLFVGFGQESTRMTRRQNSCESTRQGEGFGVKRRGSNTLASVTAETVSSSGWADRATAARNGAAVGQNVSVRPGDSGGPWIACVGANCDGKRLFAVNSTGTTGLTQDNGTGTLLTSRVARELFAAAIRCGGAGPCAANFAGSGVAAEEPPPPVSGDAAMAVGRETEDGRASLYVGVDAAVASAGLCAGSLAECTRAGAAVERLALEATRGGRKLFRSAARTLQAGGRFTLFGYDASGRATARREVVVEAK